MLAKADFVSGWRPGQTNEEYHSDASARSRSQIITVIEESPAAFFERHVRGSYPSETTPSMAFGTLLHHAILEGSDFLKRYIIAPNFTELFGHANSKVHKEAKAAWYEENAGRLIVTRKELDDIEGMTASVLEHPDAVALLKNGIVETSGYYADPETRIALRFRPDLYGEGLGVLADVKTTESCREDNFMRSIAKYRYDFQMAMYAEGIYQITGKRVEFPVFIALEKKPPYECAVYILNDEAMQNGLRDYRRALESIRSCYDNNRWPKYQSKMKTIGLPHWAMKESA